MTTTPPDNVMRLPQDMLNEAYNTGNGAGAEQEIANMQQLVDDSSRMDDLANIGAGVVANDDNDRIRSGAHLLNAFNFAVQIQGQRNNWLAGDFRAFLVAHAAMNGIRPTDR